MLDCGHIFCLQCLQDFYNDAITEGNLSVVRCLTPNCAKSRASQARSTDKSKKPKVSISPSELLKIGLSEDTVKRYVTLKYKTELESDKNTIYCPRQWCNGAARSKKHKKPVGFEYEEASDVESAEEDSKDANPDGKRKKKRKTFDRTDLLAVCEDCGLAFCSRCMQSWHGEFVLCAPKRNKEELTEEEKASLEYLQLHTSPCPTCSAPAQKTHGCNHMICSRCDTHFCYLCSSWLDPTNPYRHYNTQDGGKVTSCYMRLWELEGGDGDDVGHGFIGGYVNGANPAEPNEIEIPPEEVDVAESDTEPEDANDNIAEGERLLDDQGRPVAVAREAPLVLRLMDDQPRGARNDQRAVPPAAPDAPQPPARRGNQPPRPVAGRGRGGGARAGRAGGRGGRGGRGAGNRQVQPHQNQEQNQNQNQAQNQRQPQQQQRNAVPNQGQVQEGLDEAQAAWVRAFVQMALMDEEGDSDEDDWPDH